MNLRNQVFLATFLLVVACGGGSEAPPTSSETPVPAAASQSRASEGPSSERSSEGYVVWESNRSGAWRLFIAELDGSNPRQLTDDEAGRAHCCPHVSPDGHSIAYLSLPADRADYPTGGKGAVGELRLIDRASGEERTLHPHARTYFEHRAAVWKSPGELIFIDGQGRTRLLEIESGRKHRLTEEGEEQHGWLIDPTLRWATRGEPTFSRYDSERRTIDELQRLGGCQPYFTRDGRWGYWIAGAGGPIERIDLATREISTILAKSDPRLPSDRGYLYFPMSSPDGLFFAWAASDGAHDHQSADYDVFVAETDPETLEILGEPWRVSSDPATDRFPDVWAAPLALGRHFGEAPFTLELENPRGGTWRWSWEEPGTYAITAESGGEKLTGSVRVRPARPPRLTGTEFRGERRVALTFDEPIAIDGVEVSLASGGEVVSWHAADEGRSLEIELAGELTGADTVLVENLRDRAQVHNVLGLTKVEIAPPAWPAENRGLSFLWQNAEAPNRVGSGEAARTTLLEAHGRAWLDRHHAMVLRGGHFTADSETAVGVYESAKAANELSLELTLTPARARQSGPARILTFSSNDRTRNFTLAQEGDRLVFRLRTPETGQNADQPQVELGRIPAGRPSHVAVTYKPGRLTYFRDGREELQTDVLQGGFFHWKPRPLLLGDEWQAERPWEGTIEGVAIYARELPAAEVAENARRYRELIEKREALPLLRLRSRLEARAAIPTLEEISPYREALAVYEYRVLEVLEGTYSRDAIRVVHRVLQDAERLPATERRVGEVFELELEPFAAQPQLQSLYLSEKGLEENYELELYYSPEL